MNSQVWDENQIVQAYERNFALLESARKEYEQSSNSLLDEITTKVNARQESSSFDEGIRLNVIPSEQGFSRRMMEFQLVASEEFSRLRVFVRMATPWGGSTGCLQIGAVAHLDDKKVSQTFDTLRQTICKEGNLTGFSFTKSVSKLEPNWLHAAELEINSAVAENAADYVGHALKELSSLALVIDTECSFTQFMRQGLEGVLQSLKSDSPFPDGWNLQSKLGWWNGMHFVQLDCEKRFSFWVGYHVAKQHLMYGHSDLKEDPKFAKRFFAAAKAKPPASYGAFPAGVVMEKDVLESQAVQDVEKFVSDLFRLFCITANGPMSSPSTSRPG